MKKVINITIGKVVFNVEEDAYKKLSDYLDSIKKHFQKDKDRDEILEDIEISIAEKFVAKRSHKDAAITIEDVKIVVDQMGTIKDFKEIEKDEVKEEKEEKDEKEEDEDKESKDKKLYRDPDDVIIAGVASGVAAYLGVDTVFVRLAFFITIFFGGAGIILYIVLWIIMPVATTTAQKLEMRGESITLKEIEKSVKKGVEKLKKKEIDKSLNSFFKVVGKIVLGFLEFLRVVVGLGFLLSGLVGIFACSFSIAWIFVGEVFPFLEVTLIDFVDVGGAMYWIFSGALYFMLMIPFLIIFLLGLSLMTKKKIIKAIPLMIMLVIWFVSLGVFSAVIIDNREKIEDKVLEIHDNFEEVEERIDDFLEVEIPKEQVSLDGRVSDLPWQHMIDIPDTHPNVYYFDLADDSDQLVIYSRKDINCEDLFWIEGDYITIEGESKRPGSDEKVSELQVLVESFECL
ncbi:PspC domain-containing protein [Patescibacteria group bacterium]